MNVNKATNVHFTHVALWVRGCREDGEDCMCVVPKNKPHHSQHIGVSHYHSNACHSTASHSSRNKSCQPGVHHRSCRRNMLGARVYCSQPFLRRWLGPLLSCSICSNSRTKKEVSKTFGHQKTDILIVSPNSNEEQQMCNDFMRNTFCWKLFTNLSI